MADQYWDSRFRRTGFYETRTAHPGFFYQVPVPVYLVNVAGSELGPFVEPADYQAKIQEGATSGNDIIAWAYGKADEVVEMGSRLNGIIEQKCPGEPAPTRLHAFAFGWPS